MLRRSHIVVALAFLSVASLLFTRPQAYLSGWTDGILLERTSPTNTTGLAECGTNKSSSAPRGEILDRTDWFEDSLWKERCLKVEHVCYSTGRWWYNTDRRPHSQNRSTSSTEPSPHQPNLTLVVHKDSQTSYPIEISLGPATAAMQNLTCPYSPIPNHLVLYSLYNDMLGEFVIRLLVGLVQMLPPAPQQLEHFLAATQVYLHLYSMPKKTLLESHYAFLAPFGAHPLLDFQALLQSPSCACVERLLLCGYYHDNSANDNIDSTKDNNINSAPLKLQPGPGFPLDKFQHDPAPYREHYHFLHRRVIHDNPLLTDDIAKFRRRLLHIHAGLQPSPNATDDDYDSWTIVGLAQRSGRRKWLNLADTLRACQAPAVRAQKIMCLTVNVEEPAYTPLHHVVVHGSLDALVGIHGAQLTDALWMKPGSAVVEILPYLPPTVTYGSWTRSVHGPTPLGLLFKGTDLTHVGLPLDWQSVPQCATKTDAAFVECVRARKWDGRDFTVPADRVRAVWENLARRRERPTECGRLSQLAGPERGLVLYNAWCSNADDVNDTAGSHYIRQMENRFFYWNQSIETYEAYSSVPESSSSNASSVTAPP